MTMNWRKMIINPKLSEEYRKKMVKLRAWLGGNVPVSGGWSAGDVSSAALIPAGAGRIMVFRNFFKDRRFGRVKGPALPETPTSPPMGEDHGEEGILKKSNIRLGLPARERYDAIRLAGRMLYEGGYVTEAYIEAMVRREQDLSTYIGKGVAIPHGVGCAKGEILKSGLVVLQFPDGINFDDEVAYLLIGIAGVGNEHLDLLANIATTLDRGGDEIPDLLRTTRDVDRIYHLFT